MQFQRPKATNIIQTELGVTVADECGGKKHEIRWPPKFKLLPALRLITDINFGVVIPIKQYSLYRIFYREGLLLLYSVRNVG
jgi:hypothetical protein